MDEETKKIIYKEALTNAYIYGSTNTKIVISKIMAAYPELRKEARTILPEIDKVVSTINSLSSEDIRAKMEMNYPEIVEELAKEEEKEFLDDLPNAKKGKVKVRYPPEPSKHPHIGQLLSFCINHLIAEKFDGKTVLRFDDTNPEKVKKEYYESFREAINWLGLQLDEEVRASDYMNVYYDKAKELIKKNEAYVCFCTREKMSKLRNEEKKCECNLNQTVEQNLAFFEKLVSGNYKTGESVVRLKGEMDSPNAVLRDPVLLRLSDAKHCIQEEKYVLWPMYDFESPIMEHITGVTHVLRSQEFGKMRQELQSLIAKKLNLNVPEFYQYSRYNIRGSTTKGREIRKLVEENVVSGWDDIRLMTYQALRKRGIQPQTFIEIVKTLGATKSITNIDWSLIASINRKILHPQANHYFFVDNPIELKFKTAIDENIAIPLHPEDKARGTRILEISDRVFISGQDAKFLKMNTMIRLKDLFNIKIVEKIADSKWLIERKSGELLSNLPKVQWVSDYIPVEIIKPEMLYLNNRINKDSLKLISGYGEKNLLRTKENEIIQLERFGFVKINEKNKKIKMNYIHG